MKKTFLLLGLIPTLFWAQSKDLVCKQNTKALDSLMRLSQWETAIDIFDEVKKNCPDQWSNLSRHAAGIYDYRISKVSGSDKEVLIKELLSYYDQYAKNVPSEAKTAQMRKARAMQEYQVGTADEIFNLYDQAFRTGGIQFNDANAIRSYFVEYVQRAKATKDFSVERIFTKKEEFDTLLEQLIEKYPSEEEYPILSRSLNRLMAVELNCENLNAYYNTHFEKRKNDTIWVRKGAERLADANCHTNSPTRKFLELSYSQKPTYKIAFELGQASLRANKMSEAEQYFQSAVNLTKDSFQRAELNFTIGTTVYGQRDKAKAIHYLELALKDNPAMGKAYLYMAQMYARADKDCAPDEFSQKALKWLAAETVKKASTVQPGLKAGTEPLYKKYWDEAPSAKEIKAAKMGGKKIDYGCWINKSVQVPK